MVVVGAVIVCSSYSSSTLPGVLSLNRPLLEKASPSRFVHLQAKSRGKSQFKHNASSSLATFATLTRGPDHHHKTAAHYATHRTQQWRRNSRPPSKPRRFLALCSQAQAIRIHPQPRRPSTLDAALSRFARASAKVCRVARPCIVLDMLIMPTETTLLPRSCSSLYPTRRDSPNPTLLQPSAQNSPIMTPTTPSPRACNTTSTSLSTSSIMTLRTPATPFLSLSRPRTV